MIQHTYINGIKHQQISLKLFLLIFMAACWLPAASQNLNNPNKTGPLNTQVNTLTGNLFIPRSDIFIKGRGMDLDIKFFYNSYNFDQNEGYGNGWNFKYNVSYKKDTVPGRRLICWGEGREDAYDSLPGGGYSTPKGFYSKLHEYQPGKLILVLPDSTRYLFENNIHRKLTRIEEPNGNYIQLHYTDSLLTNLEHSSGQSVQLNYNAAGRLETLVDANASPTKTFTYSYDAAGNLKEVKDPLNGKYAYTYLVNGPMKTLTDKNANKLDIIYFPDLSAREIIGCNKRISFSYDTSYNKTVVTDYQKNGTNQVTTYTYDVVDGLGWVTSITGNCCGLNVKYEYDANGNKIKMTDANGNQYAYTYDSRGNILSTTDPMGGKHIYTYSADFNKITTYKDPKGNLYTLNYNNKGNLEELIMPGNKTFTASYNSYGDIVSSTDPNGNVFNYSYDAFGNPATVSGPGNYFATLEYNARGELVSFMDARGNQHNLETDILGRLKKITDPLSQTMEFNYDAQGNVVSIKDKNNKTTSISYDASSRPVKYINANGKVEEIVYDAMDNVTSFKNPLGIVSSFSYDSRNRLTAFTDALGNVISIEYDANSNVKSVSFPGGRLLNYEFDKLDRVTRIKDGTGDIARFTYDANGNITSYTNGLGAITSATYDNLDRITSLTDPLGNKRSYTYDDNDNVKTITDRNGFVSHLTYDSLDRLKSFTDPEGGIITIGYDAENNMTSLQDQNGNTTTYTYDQLNRRKRMTYPDGSFNELDYDNNNNIISNRLTDGSIITYQYDNMNRIISKSLPGGEVFSYVYDDAGRIISATNGAGTVNIGYDALNRIVSESFDNRTVTYSYNDAGRTQTISYPGGRTVVKSYDDRSRLASVFSNDQLIAEYSYNSENLPVNILYGNGTITTMQYDMGNRMTSMQNSGPNILNNSFTYDKEGNKTQVNRFNNPLLSEEYTYDDNYRLVQHKKGNVTNNYTYDAVGNRVAASINGAAKNYTINNLNQMTAINGAARIYDGRGNLAFDGMFHKFYDAEGRLVKDSSAPASVITYVYDAFDRRIIKSINGNSLKYTYAGLAPVEERNNSGVIQNQTVFTHFLKPVVNVNNESNFYYHQNELNSVEAISNTNGRLMENFRYDAFGKLSVYDSLGNPIASSITGNRFGFTGQQYDSATAGFHFYYRNYAPETGLFSQRDLIEYEDGMGMYQYVGNNPANGIDILGLEDCSKTQERNDIAYETSAINYATTNTLDATAYKLRSDATKAFKEASEIKLNRAARRNAQLGRGENLVAKKTALNNTAGAKGVKGNKMAMASDRIGKGMNVADNLIKGEAMLSSFADGQSNEQYTQEVQATGDFLLSGLAWTGVGSVFSGIDFVVESTTGDGLSTHSANAGTFYGNLWAYYEYGVPMSYVSTESTPCPENGTRRRPRDYYDPVTGEVVIIAPRDPNEIIGPEGVKEKKYVSVKSRMPYTILCENDKSATAPAKYIRISTPMEPNQDAGTFQLGSFGFNNQSFSVPAGLTSYYTRLDCRDSMDLYVDVVAGFDQMKNEVFWEFRSIDPITLLPTEDPEKGLLFLQDSSQPLYGHGFVNFSIIPKASAQTLDTIGARASIVFDINDTIPTNIYTNTIDAVAPQSQMVSASFNDSGFVHLQWTGSDDPGGSGIKNYTVYVATDGINYTVIAPEVFGTDTTIQLPMGAEYCFFVLATDLVGHTEIMDVNDIACASLMAPLPVTWLYFKGKNVGKHNLLEWATAEEHNTSKYVIERSANGNDFADIGELNSIGNSSATTQYQFTDMNVDKLEIPSMYYRLRQIDLDGGFKYSNIIRINIAREVKRSVVFPNPTSGLITVSIGDANLIGREAMVYNETGTLIQRVLINGNNFTINLSGQTNGIYLIRLSETEILKVIKL